MGTALRERAKPAFAGAELRRPHFAFLWAIPILYHQRVDNVALASGVDLALTISALSRKLFSFRSIEASGPRACSL